MIPIFFAVTVIGLLLPRLAYAKVRSLFGGVSVDHMPLPVLLVGRGPLTAILVEYLAHPQAGGRLYPVGILDEEVPVGRRIGTVPVLGRPEDLRQVLALLRLRGQAPRHLLLTAPASAFGAETLEQLERTARAAGVRVRYALPFLAGDGPPAEASPASMVRCEASPWSAWRYPLDRVLAAAGLVVTAPLLLVAMVLLALDPGPPVIFRQVRPGRDLIPFRLVKLRTLRDPLDAADRLDVAARMSRVGRLVRYLRLDELLQLWNVVRGEMALIGPRPLVLEDLEQMPEQGRGRFAVRPGITGWAQVNGGNDLRPEEKYALDLWYIAHASPWLDLEIVWRTLLMVTRGERRDEAAIAEALSWYRTRAMEPATAGLSAGAAA